MRCLRLGSIPQASAPAAPQTVDPVEDAAGPSTLRACEPLAAAAKHRGCVGVGHEQASELALIIALDELDASCTRDDAQLVEPTVVVLPRYGPNAVTHDRLEQSHTPEISQIDAAPMLAFARSAEVIRSPRAYATHGCHPRFSEIIWVLEPSARPPYR